jgi:hypothetical protein
MFIFIFFIPFASFLNDPASTSDEWNLLRYPPFGICSLSMGISGSWNGGTVPYFKPYELWGYSLTYALATATVSGMWRMSLQLDVADGEGWGILQTHMGVIHFFIEQLIWINYDTLWYTILSIIVIGGSPLLRKPRWVVPWSSLGLELKLPGILT